VFTGNFRALAERKLILFGLDRYLDLHIAGYEDDVDNRAGLVAIARIRVAAQHGVVVPAETVLVGDTPNGIKAAHEGGRRAVAVATGSTSAEELTPSGCRRRPCRPA